MTELHEKKISELFENTTATDFGNGVGWINRDWTVEHLKQWAVAIVKEGNCIKGHICRLEECNKGAINSFLIEKFELKESDLK